jgi:short-subunit dehydrogenase
LAGARVALVGLEPVLLKQLASELGEQHLWVECDVCSIPAMQQAVAQILEKFGRIDVVVANAGIASSGTVATTPTAALLKTVEVNLNGVINTVSQTLPAMTQSQGYYLLVSSAAALKSTPGSSAYSASKSGVDHFANAFRLEVAHKGIDVGVVYPAWVDTDLVKDQQNLDSFNEMLKQLPWPFSVITSVDDCSQAFVEAIESRKRKQYIPKALASIGPIRQVFMSPLWEHLLQKRTRTAIPKAEAEIQARGLSFGSSSVGSQLLKQTDQH